MTIQSTTRKRQELIENLRRSEEQTKVAKDWLQTTIESIGDAVIATDEAGKVILLNAVAESLTGWTLEQALGLPLEQILILVNEETGQAPENPVARALREESVVGLASGTILISKDGRRIPIEDSAAPIRDASNRIAGVVLVFRDVTQRRAAEQKERYVAIELAQLAAIIESSDDAIISKDLNGIVTSWNRGAERIFGYTKEEMIGRPISVLASPSRADEMPRILEQIARGEHIDHFETTRRTKDGRDIDISLTVSPIRDSKGVIVGASKISRNITERILAEKEQRRQAELIERSNADLKYFAYAASHDLREPLRTIAVYTQILERHLHATIDAESSANLQAIMSATGRMAHLIDGLLEYSKAGESGRLPAESIDMESALAVALANLEGSIEENHAVITHDQLPSVPGSELHFVQLFQNVISNSIKYRGADSPSIHVSAQPQGKKWRFSVRDNGQGISPEYHAQIFELFKRLHGQDHPGSGIGLATCKKIIELYGGKIWVESQAGEGATFFFTVPTA
jgi:PAS domain S-box-containing protein